MQLSIFEEGENYKESLEEALIKILNFEIKGNRKAQLEIDSFLAKHKIEYGILNEILINNEKIYDLGDEEKCLLSMATTDVLGDEVFDYKQYFNSNEIKKSKKYIKEFKNPFHYPYVISGVLRGSDTLYSAFISAQQLKELWENEGITYNMEVQRLPKERRRRDGTVYRQPDIKLKSTKEISRLMKSGRYKSNSIILNILMNGEDEVEYIDGDLIIHEGTNVNIIDGAHRLEGIIKAIESDPDFDMMIPVLIYHLPLAEAQDALSQINTFNPFDKTLVKFFGNKKISDEIAKELRNINEFSERVRIKTTIPKNSFYLTNFAILSESIDKAFNPETTKDRFRLSKILKRFYGYLISSFSDEFVDKFLETKEISWINHHNTFYGYTFLCKKLVDKYGDDFPIEKIDEIISNIDFSKKEGLEYNDIISPQGKVNSNTIKKNIASFFSEIEV